MLILGEEIPTLEDVVEGVIDVKHLFPLWITERSESNSPSNHMVKFIQSYYDWLYNKGGYELSTTTFHTVGLRRLLDIDETPVEFLKHFTYTYASGFPEWYIGLTAGPGGTDTSPFIRTFIKNVRQGLYQRKSSEEAYRYFFESLFDAPEISIAYPKKWTLRLNGGRFSNQGEEWAINVVPGGGGTGSYDAPTDWEPGHPDHPHMHMNLGGSYLNGPYKIQDSYWYQDYSYLLKTGVDVVDPETGLPVYFDVLQTLLHPAGLKGFWEKTEADYIPPDDYDGGFQDCESPKLGNYFPYKMTGNVDYVPCIGCSGSGHTYAGYTAFVEGLPTFGSTGWTYGDAWSTAGPGSISLGGYGGDAFDIPTFAFPHWSDGICGDNSIGGFGNIYIGDFMYLCPINISPNLGVTGCTAYEDTNAGPCWS